MNRFLPAIRQPGEARRPAAQPALELVAAGALTGTVASLAAGAALAAAARAEGRGALQPINATSHWLRGRRAGGRRHVDLEHTGTGLATHQASSMFWGTIFEGLRAARRRRTPATTLCDAALVAGVAAVVDYGLVPRRISPGLELALTPRGVAAGFAGMALGLAAGGFLTDALRR
jgi:hypothetical protein